MKYITLFLILVVLEAAFPKPKTFPNQYAFNQMQNQVHAYQTLNFTQKVSHFNYKLTGKTFAQKYLLDLSKWSKSEKGPILMYCGNEGPIEMFYKNSGWYNDEVSQQLKGMIVYPQHRYFGTSWPFGDKKTSLLPENLVYLTTEQAMMDFVEFIRFLKATYCTDCPVIVFGGSYGGMLATWMRMKYPHVVDYAHAASAPIYYYKNRKNFDIGVFYKIVTKNYEKHNQNCPNVIREAFRRLLEYYGKPSAPIAALSKYFNLCTPLKNYQDIAVLMDYINAGYSYMAMLNYPYPTSFLKNLTAWPANSSCIPLDPITVKSSDEQLFTGIRNSIEYYYSYNKTQCNQIYDSDASDEDMGGWDVLACGDQAMPMSTDGQTDMFYKADFDYVAYSQFCKQTFGISPDYQYTLNHFGGVTDEQYKAASYIIFTNGGLDPWSGASPTRNLSNTLLSCYIPNGAHHLDLRPSNPADPSDVIQCRSFVLNTLATWISNRKMEQKQRNNIRTQSV